MAGGRRAAATEIVSFVNAPNVDRLFFMLTAASFALAVAWTVRLLFR